MLFNLSNVSEKSIRTLRFTVGVTLTIALAFGVNWPLAFITPMFVAKLLGSDKPKMAFKELMGIFSIMLITFTFGILITRLLLPYPVVFILIATLTVFWIAYWNNSGGNEFAITMLLVGITVIPMIGLLHQAAAVQFTFGFLKSCLLSLFIVMIMHELFPDNPSEVELQAEKEKIELAPKITRIQLSILTTIIIMPVMCFFLFFDLSSAVLILAFIAILAQNPDLLIGLKGSKALLVGNTIGGIIAIAMYSILVAMPSFTFMLLLFMLLLLLFSQKLFSDSPLVPLYAMALSTIIILIANSSLSDATTASESFYTRILQITGACTYIVITTLAATPWLSKIRDAAATNSSPANS